MSPWKRIKDDCFRTERTSTPLQVTQYIDFTNRRHVGVNANAGTTPPDFGKYCFLNDGPRFAFHVDDVRAEEKFVAWP